MYSLYCSYSFLDCIYLDKSHRMSAEPLTAAEYASLATHELDIASPLGVALLSEPWLNFAPSRRLFWVQVLSIGVIHCSVTLSPTRRQCEVEVELEPGQSVAFCVSLWNFDRFL